MKIKFLGNWSSHMKRGVRNSSIILDDRIVFDFGPHTLESVLERGIDPCKIEKVLITHMHLDHYLGLPELIWYRSAAKVREPLIVMGPAGIRDATGRLLELVNTPGEGYSVNVDYTELKNSDDVSVYEGNHIIPDNVYRVEYMGKTLVFTGDTAYHRNVVRAAEDADVLIHEMTYGDDNKQIADFWKHSTYSSVMQTFEESGAGILVPTHLTDETFNQVSSISLKESSIRLPVEDLTL